MGGSGSAGTSGTSSRRGGVRALACALLLPAAAGCSWQAGMVYHPTREVGRTPADAGMAFEEVALRAADGVKLHGWFVPAPGKSRGALVFCHGNAGNISHRLESIAVFRSLGLDVVVFDYRGYGRSEGRPSEKGTYLDAEAAWDHLVTVRKVAPERIVVFGRSLGGAIAAHLAAERNPRALILESALSSAPQMVAWPLRWLVGFDYATAKYVRAVKCPVLVVHSTEDQVIPFRHGQRIFAAASEPKTFLEIRGDHNGGWLESRGVYLPGLARFLDAHLARPEPDT